MNVELFPFLGVRFPIHIFRVTLLICRQLPPSAPQRHRTNGFVMISGMEKFNQRMIPFLHIPMAIACVHGFLKDHWMDRTGMSLIGTKMTQQQILLNIVLDHSGLPFDIIPDLIRFYFLHAGRAVD
jgi:hypothetical protein